MQSHQGSRVLSFEEDLVAAMGDEIVSTDNKTGKTRWKRKIDGDMAKLGGAVRSQPVIEGGWIYVGTENGRLVGIDTKNPEFTGWATWGGDAARTGVYQAKK